MLQSVEAEIGADGQVRLRERLGGKNHLAKDG